MGCDTPRWKTALVLAGGLVLSVGPAKAEALAAPPGEPQSLRWCAAGKDCLEWDPASPPGRYRVVQGGGTTLPDLADAGADSCSVGTFSGLTTGAVLTETPLEGDLFWYLVLAESCTVQGTAGAGISGPRLVDAPFDCATPTCSDGLADGGESDIDCGGGVCAACAGGGSCCETADCASALCMLAGGLGACAAETCTNGALDGGETDVDCGGGACPGCAAGKQCNVGDDCLSQVCTSGQCAAPTCTDGVLNGTETDVDCGGLTCGFCADESMCLANSDCASGICEGETCQPDPSCPGGASAASFAVSLPVSLPTSPLLECGGSGNTYWSFAAATLTTNAALDLNDTIYLTSGERVSRLDPATGTETNFRILPGVTLGRPLVYEGNEPIGSPPHFTRLVFAGSNGYVYDLNTASLTLSDVWSRSLRRPTCASDSIAAPVVGQVWEQSDSNFRAVQTKDLVIAGTDYACGATTTNRVYGLNGSTGEIVWIFNPTGASQMDRVNDLAVDHSRNLVYAVSEHSNAGSQNTVWALRTTNGSKRWSLDLGAVEAEPVLGNGGLYVVTVSGTLYKLDPATGSTIWQHVVTSTDTLTRLAADPSLGRIYVLDSAGQLHAVDDDCAAGTTAWTFKPVGALVTTNPVILGGFLYVGADDGKTWQVRTADGVGKAWATISASGAAPSNDPLVFFDGPDSRLLASSGYSVKKLCIPWPDTPGDKALLLGPPGGAVEDGRWICLLQTGLPRPDERP